MSIVRTYYSWQLATSPDKSYLLAVCGLCSDAELSVGVLIGCFPTMPKFFQHIGPKISEILSYRSKAVSENGDNSGHRSMIPETHALTKIKNPFAKYKVGLSVFESCNDPYAQLHGEHHTWNGSEASQPQAATELAPVQEPGANVATRRGDLEYDHQSSWIGNGTELQAQRLSSRIFFYIVLTAAITIEVLGIFTLIKSLR